MTSNSKIFTSAIFGNSSGKTAQELVNKNLETQELFLAEIKGTKLSVVLPTIPSNQRLVKD